MRGAAVWMAMALAGCAGGMKAAPLALSIDHEIAVKRAIADKLKDPQSARFGGMSAARIEATGIVRVCGTVNAKNSYGGYGGDARFAADLNDQKGAPNTIPAFVDGVVGSPGRDIGLDVICGQVGL